jgi:hypothetical protein
MKYTQPNLSIFNRIKSECNNGSSADTLLKACNSTGSITGDLMCTGGIETNLGATYECAGGSSAAPCTSNGSSANACLCFNGGTANGEKN